MLRSFLSRTLAIGSSLCLVTTLLIAQGALASAPLWPSHPMPSPSPSPDPSPSPSPSPSADPSTSPSPTPDPSPSPSASPDPLASPSPDPSPSPGPDIPMTVSIQSMAVNDGKADSATSSDIQLVRAGSSVPEATVTVGTKLSKGDKISTSDGAQVVLQISYEGNENVDLLFLDPKSEAEIGSVCAIRGSWLVWAASKLGLCSRYGVVAVGGTQFKIDIKPTGEMEVVVYEGEVTFNPATVSATVQPSPNPTPPAVPGATPNPTPAVSAIAPPGEAKEILAGEALKITPTQTEKVRVPATRLRTDIDRWSWQMVKTNKYRGRASTEKAFGKNEAPDKRANTFVKARREALLNNSDEAYLEMAQALNDWNNGQAAQVSLSEIKSVTVKASPEFMVNEVEAYHLQGNVRAANTKIDKTLIEYPDYGAAKVLKGQLLLESIPPGVEDANRAAQAKKLFGDALQGSRGKDLINTKVVEVNLQKTVKTVANEEERRQPGISTVHRWLKPNSRDVVTYSGTGTLNLGGERITGKTTLSVVGNQFILNARDRIFTGRITDQKIAEGLSFKLDFDDVVINNQVRDNLEITVVGSKTANRIELSSARRGSFVFLGKAVN